MVLRYLLKVLFCLCLSFPAYCWAADAVPAETTAGEVAAQGPAFPGFSKLSQRTTALAEVVAAADKRLPILADLSKQKEALAGLSAQFQKLTAEMIPLGSPDDWYVDRLTAYLKQFAQIQKNLDGSNQEITLRLQEIETIQNQAQQDKEFWRGWEQELRQDIKVPKQTLKEVSSLLAKLDAALKKTTEPLLAFQQSISTLQLEVSSAEERLIVALGKLRQATFRKNTDSFFSASFYQLLSRDLGQQMKEGLAAALSFDRNYSKDNSLLIGLMLAGFLLVAGVLQKYRRDLQKTDEWHFILNHPFAAAIFSAGVFFWCCFPAPPPLFQFIVLLLSAISATAMAIPLLENRRQARVLALAALVILLTSAFRLIALPQPLFRIYLACLAIIFIPLLIQQVLLSKKLRNPGQGRYFRALLRITVVVLFASLVGQVAGYINFSSWLIQATFETATVLLFVKMAVLLMSGTIALGNNLLTQSGPDFFKKFGVELSLRLKKLLTFFIYVFSIFYLLPVWRLFATLNDSWNYFTQFTIEIGQLSISMQMVLSAISAFYLALQVSWILQGASETQILSRRSVDRGVRDAVKKLIHYGVVLIGFLFALSLLGLGLQNFVVLLGALGVGIGFGLQDIVNNFLSGLILLFERPIKVGDGILIDGEYGTVKRIGLRSTIVENLDQAELIVPNAQIISQKVTNWTLSNRQVRIVIPVGVAYGSDLEIVLAILSEAGAQHAEVLEVPKPTPFFLQFGSSSLDFELRVWISNVDDRPRIKNELLLYIDRRFREAKVEIPFPQRDLHLRSVVPGALAVPAQPEQQT